MPSEVITLVAVLSATLAADLLDHRGTGGAALERLLTAHEAHLVPLQYATRADDGSLYVTVTAAAPGDIDSLQFDLENLPGVLSVYRKPAAEPSG